MGKVNRKDIDEFINKIQEAIIKYQRTLPKQLPQEEIIAITKLCREVVTYNISRGHGFAMSLKGMIDDAILASTCWKDDIDLDNITGSFRRSFHGLRCERIIEAIPTLSNVTNGGIGEQLPFLRVHVEDDLLIIENHAKQCLYSTRKRDGTINNYLVKGYMQVLREVQEREERSADEGRT